MRYFSLILIIGVLLVAAADAKRSRAQITQTGAGKVASTAVQPTGDVLMVDGTSLILQTDGASFICRAGGC